MRVLEPLVLCGMLACAYSACRLALDVDDYAFVDADAGAPDASLEQEPPLAPPAAGGAPSEPPLRPEVGLPQPSRPPVAATTDAGASISDAGGPMEEPSPEPQPEPVPPSPRIGSVEATTFLFGTVGGEPRRADCVDGAMVGVEFWYLPSSAINYPDRLAFVAPLCMRLDALDEAIAAGIAGPLEPPAWAGPEQGFNDTLPGHWPEELYEALLCPPGQVVQALSGSFDAAPESATTSALRTFSLDCATLAQTEEVSEANVVYASTVVPVAPFAITGGTSFFDQCLTTGGVAAGLEVHSGAWLDGFALRCGVVRWPFEAGHSCQLGVQCASGVCDGLGFCADGP